MTRAYCGGLVLNARTHKGIRRQRSEAFIQALVGGGGVVSHVCLMRNSHAELGGENRFLEFRVAFCGSTRVKSPPPLGPKGLQ